MKYGHMDAVRGSVMGVKRILVDGVDVDSMRVFELDDEEGWVHRYKLNEDGHTYVDEENDCVAWERLEGVVEVFLS